ncbi:MAG TPA: RpiB/LacA/LacB family sugar-phosphate isomerase, partial [Vicinamibacterales bacterium]
MKARVVQLLQQRGDELVDFGAHTLDPADDFPDFVIPLALAVGRGEVGRGIAICGSGVGACVAANKIRGV